MREGTAASRRVDADHTNVKTIIIIISLYAAPFLAITRLLSFLLVSIIPAV